MKEITELEKPDYIGIVTPDFDDIDIHSLFFVYIKEKKPTEDRDGYDIRGRIIDCYGNSYFKGFLSQDEINFYGTYIPGEIVFEPSKKQFLYKVINIDGEYVGMAWFDPHIEKPTEDNSIDFSLLEVTEEGWIETSDKYIEVLNELRRKIDTKIIDYPKDPDLLPSLN